MRLLVFALLAGLSTSAFASPSDVSIPDRDTELIKATDDVEVSGTNDLGGIENFAIHDPKAIGQFIQLLTDDRYTAVAKNLKPNFKSLSAYKVRLSAKGAPLLELRIIADTVLDLPNEDSFYMESDQYSENLMAPLMRLR
jgi:hypothetical protein